MSTEPSQSQFLPPYSPTLPTPPSLAWRGPWPAPPDLNPIEMLFAKLKALFRKADQRTLEAAWREIGKLLDQFKPDECAAYLRHAGYGDKTV